MSEETGDSCIDTLYHQLIIAVINQNKRLEEQLGMKLSNFDRLYRMTETPFDDRLLTTRWVKIPTFIHENTSRYYAVMLASINMWRKGELKPLYRQIIDSIDAQDIDSHTIFLIGRSEGFFDKMDNRLRYYHIIRINSQVFGFKQRNIVTGIVTNYLRTRLHRIAETGVVTPMLSADMQRLQYFIDTFTPTLVITRNAVPRARYVSNTSIRINQVLANTNTNTRSRIITRAREEGGEI